MHGRRTWPPGTATGIGVDEALHYAGTVRQAPDGLKVVPHAVRCGNDEVAIKGELGPARTGSCVYLCVVRS